MKKKVNYTIIITVIILCGFVLQRKYLNEFPSHIHAWAQSDRYALAIGFTKNNFDFFHPQTYVLNHQFPDTFKVPSENTITAVDFPIHDYIPALIMKLFKSTSPWCFRLYILLYSFIGLFFLYKLTDNLGMNIYKSILIIVIAISSPVFAYYQAGFLPTIPSLSNGIIGLYFYMRYLKNNRINSFCWAIFFLTIAALSRIPFSILLIAIIGFEFLKTLKVKSFELKKIFCICFSIASLIGYYLYNNYLTRKYGSMFLNHIMTPSNLKELIEILRVVKQNWLYQYFSKIHYIVFIVLAVISIYSLMKNKKVITYIQKQLFFIILIIFIGCFMYSFLMLKQFPAHDYYFLDTFFIPIILSIALMLSIIPGPKIGYTDLITTLAIFLISFFLIANAVNVQEVRRQTGSWDLTGQSINNFKHSKEFLDSLKIPENSKILDLCSLAPNIPFILMDRKGYATLTTSEKNIKKELTWKYDFIVVQNEFFLSEIYSSYPDIINEIEKVGDNNKISIYKLNRKNKKQTLIDFLGLNARSPLMKNKITFDSVAGNEWQNTKKTDLVSKSGKYSGMVTKDDEFGITFKQKDIKEFKNKSILLYLKANFLIGTEPLKDLYIVASISTPDKNIYYKSYDLAGLLTPGKTWQQIDLTFQLPQINENDFEVGIYIWNKGRNLTHYDDFEIQLF
jgi:hypothetical protein